MMRARAMRTISLVGLAALAVMLASCASLEMTQYHDEPGVSATIITTEGKSFSATLVGTEDGMVVFDRSYPKSESLTVVERGGELVALVGRMAVGTAVEIREFDVLVRERHPFSRVEEVRVATSAYFGWGAVLGAVLTFAFVSLSLED